MLALTKNDKNTNINWYINFIWRYLKKSLVRSSFIILPSTILRTTSGGGKVSAGGSNPTGVAENGGTGSSKTATVNSTVLCVSGGYSAWDVYNNSFDVITFSLDWKAIVLPEPFFHTTLPSNGASKTVDCS